jgi:hypothetical protein
VIRPVGEEDLSLLIGLLAVCEVTIWMNMDGDLCDGLQQHWRHQGPLPTTGGRYEVRQLLNDLNHRLRYAKGEYEEPPVPEPLPE